MSDTPECGKHTGQYMYASTCMQALGFVRDAAEVGRVCVWGSFRRSTFRRKGGVDSCRIFDLTLKRPLVAKDEEPRPRRFGPTRRGRAWGVHFVGVSHFSMT